jgi:hypothetical protein
VGQWSVSENASVVVSRPVSGIFAFRRLTIRVDDGVVARLFRGRSARVEVEPGHHTIQARLDWAKSPPIEVGVEAGAEVVVEVMAPWSALWRTWATPSRALICVQGEFSKV